MMEYVVETEKLTKAYRGGGGCFQISLKVPPGSVFGLLGPNGAGKSTLVKSLVGLVKPTAGRGRILGESLGDIGVRRRIGYLPENFRYQPWMTGYELLIFQARLKKVPLSTAMERIPRLLDLVKLSGKEHKKIKTYSKGMRQRIGMAAALISDPEIIFLDEPTSALDPVGRRETRELILQLKETGKTVFLNSHLLGEVELVCDQVAIMQDGRLVTSGTLDQLRGLEVVVDLRIRGLDDRLLRMLQGLSGHLVQKGEKVTMILPEPGLVPQVAKAVAQSGAELYEMVPRSRDLEELFINLVQNRKMEDLA